MQALAEQRSMLSQIMERLAPVEEGDLWKGLVPDLDAAVCDAGVDAPLTKAKSTGSWAGPAPTTAKSPKRVSHDSNGSMDSAGLASVIAADTSGGMPHDSELRKIVMKSRPSLYMDREEARKMSRCRRLLLQLVLSPRLELLMGLMILVNMLVMVIEEQLTGFEMGHSLGVYSQYGAGQSSREQVFMVLEVAFAIFFTADVALRMWGLGCKMFFRHRYEYFDVAVVVLSDVSIAVSMGGTGVGNIQVLRMLRTVKLLRLVRLIRHLEAMDGLHLMATALGGSFWALFWSIVLLMSIMTFSALIATLFFRLAYLEQSSRSFGSLTEDEKEVTLELFRYFGTFTRSLLTLFELSLANWPPICRFLMENQHEAFMLLALAFRLVMGVAVVGVINAVFMKETFMVAETDNDIMLRHKLKTNALHRQKMDELFNLADTDHDGHLDRHEFRRMLSNSKVRTWLAAMDLDARDADTLFDILSNSDDKLDCERLVNGVSLLKGPARSIDMHALLKAQGLRVKM